MSNGQGQKCQGGLKPDSFHFISLLSARAATFNDCIHMYQVPYLKSQITPSANDEMNKITLPSRHSIRNSSPGGLKDVRLADASKSGLRCTSVIMQSVREVV